MSSAILYLAIIVIWAVVLMPRWLRNGQSGVRPSEPGAEGADPADPDAGRAANEGTDGPARPTPAGMSGLAGTDLAGTNGEPGKPSASVSHARVLQARRRMLATLVVITSGAVAIAIAHLAASWVIIPPAIMLACFLLLLRAVARIDADRARTAALRAGARPQDGRGTPEDGRGIPQDGPGTEEGAGHTAESAPAAATAAPGADVIDISARVADQVYDQYSDAAERAVGD